MAGSAYDKVKDTKVAQTLSDKVGDLKDKVNDIRQHPIDSVKDTFSNVKDSKIVDTIKDKFDNMKGTAGEKLQSTF